MSLNRYDKNEANANEKNTLWYDFPSSLLVEQFFSATLLLH